MYILAIVTTGKQAVGCIIQKRREKIQFSATQGLVTAASDILKTQVMLKINL